jgi:hypothetical protein
MILYAIENFLAGDDVALTASSEDALYVLENLYNVRPSLPFRFTGIGAPATPEWICVEFDLPKKITLAAIFNHNLTSLAAGGDALTLKACDDPCSGSGPCDWTLPDYSVSLINRLIAGWNDLYRSLDQTRLSYRLDVIDSANPAMFLEIGEFFLGQYQTLPNARLSPGRVESPEFFRHKNVTYYGQHWMQSLASGVSLELEIKNFNDPNQIDDVRAMLQAIHEAGGKFLIVPNDRHPFVYYVALDNESDFMTQIARGVDCELLSWKLKLKTLTKGISLL